MQTSKSAEFRDVKRIFTVAGPSGTVSQIYTITQKSPIHMPHTVAPVGAIKPGAGYSLLRRDSQHPMRSRTTPSILRKRPKRKLPPSHEVKAQPSSDVSKSATGEAVKSQGIVSSVQYASTSNGPFLEKLNETLLQENPIIKPSASQSPNEPMCSEPAGKKQIENDVGDSFIAETFFVPPTQDEPMVVKKPYNLRPLKTSIPPKPLEKDPTRASSYKQPIVTAIIEKESTSIMNHELTFDESTTSAYSPENAVEDLILKTEFEDEPHISRNEGFVWQTPSEAMDDFVDSMTKNAFRNSESFYMVSHESLMEVLSTCNMCAAAADVILVRKGTTCEASIKCRKTAKHDTFWNGEKCRTLGLGKIGGGAAGNISFEQKPRLDHDLPWSLLLICLIAKIIDIPMKKLEHLCRLLFASDDVGGKLQIANSLVTSLPVVHGLTKSQLEKPMEHLKVIVVCRKLLVFLDPFNYSPLACFESPGARLWSMSDLSSALNIGLQRLQLLNSNKFSSVYVVSSDSTAGEMNEWKPVLVPDMDLVFQQALKDLKIALWHNKFQFDIRSSRAQGIFEEITKALCFFQPEVARMNELDGRVHYSMVLRDLLGIHNREYVPQVSELALLRNCLESLTSTEYRTQTEYLIRGLQRIDIYGVLNPSYEKIISTADASYVVSIQNEEPCRTTYNVMKMIEMCQEEELSLENALRVLLLLPVRRTPVDVIENICGFN